MSGDRGVFNISSNEIISKYKFGKLLAKEFSLNGNKIIEGSIKQRKDLVIRPLDMPLSNKKINELHNIDCGSIIESIALLKKQEKKMRALYI